MGARGCGEGVRVPVLVVVFVGFDVSLDDDERNAAMVWLAVAVPPDR